MEFKDYYATLGLSKTATDKEIKQAYRKLARKHHPDVNPGDKSAESRFKEINEAYEVLGDSEKRKKIFSDLQKLVAQEVPFLFVMYWETVLFFNKRIKGMPDKATNPYWLYQNFAKYWIEEE